MSPALTKVKSVEVCNNIFIFCNNLLLVFLTRIKGLSAHRFVLGKQFSEGGIENSDNPFWGSNLVVYFQNISNCLHIISTNGFEGTKRFTLLSDPIESNQNSASYLCSVIFTRTGDKGTFEHCLVRSRRRGSD